MTMYSGQVNSPVTVLVDDITSSDTTIHVSDVSIFPPAPNIATIGIDTYNPETIYYPSVSGSYLVSVIREFDTFGSWGVKKGWLAGTIISRRYTAYDHNTFKNTIEAHAIATSGIHGCAGEIIEQSDIFDSTVPSDSTSIQSAAAGITTVAARRDHIHGIAHSIADNSVVTIDSVDVAGDEYARFTASGLESRTASEVYTNLLAQTLLENDAIKLDSALSADGKYNGITRSGVAGVALAFGNLCYLAVADSRWELADADAAATTQGLLGICVSGAAGDGFATNILLIGIVRADAVFPTLTVGAPAYVSTTSGAIQVVAPSGATDCIRVVGQAWTADELWFCPSPDWFEHV